MYYLFWCFTQKLKNWVVTLLVKLAKCSHKIRCSQKLHVQRTRNSSVAQAYNVVTKKSGPLIEVGRRAAVAGGRSSVSWLWHEFNGDPLLSWHLYLHECECGQGRCKYWTSAAFTERPSLLHKLNTYDYQFPYIPNTANFFGNSVELE